MQKTRIDDIIGLVKTTEQTDSVELKKDYYRGKMAGKKRYKLVIAKIGDKSANVFEDTVTGDATGFDEYYQQGIVDLLNEYDSELQMCREKVVYWRNKANDTFGDMRTNVELEKRISELEKENKQMKFAFKRKYDYDIGEIVDEICDEDYTDGDVE